MIQILKNLVNVVEECYAIFHIDIGVLPHALSHFTTSKVTHIM
jgi:hypothetical protein